jgi:hypothetical protein
LDSSLDVAGVEKPESVQFNSVMGLAWGRGRINLQKVINDELEFNCFLI